MSELLTGKIVGKRTDYEGTGNQRHKVEIYYVRHNNKIIKVRGLRYQDEFDLLDVGDYLNFKQKYKDDDVVGDGYGFKYFMDKNQMKGMKQVYSSIISSYDSIIFDGEEYKIEQFFRMTDIINSVRGLFDKKYKEDKRYMSIKGKFIRIGDKEILLNDMIGTYFRYKLFESNNQLRFELRDFRDNIRLNKKTESDKVKEKPIRHYLIKGKIVGKYNGNPSFLNKYNFNYRGLDVILVESEGELFPINLNNKDTLLYNKGDVVTCYVYSYKDSENRFELYKDFKTLKKNLKEAIKKNWKATKNEEEVYIKKNLLSLQVNAITFDSYEQLFEMYKIKINHEDERIEISERFKDS